MDQKKYLTCNVLYREIQGRQAGIVFPALLSVLFLICALPFVPWVSLTNISSLFSVLSITSEAAQNLYVSYNVVNLLSFVYYSEQGFLGLYAMILLLLDVAAIYFHVMNIYRFARYQKGVHGHLDLYAAGRLSMEFEMIVTAATIGFAAYGNVKAGMTGFAASPLVYLLFLLALVAYLAIKVMEREERILYHEHGLLKELRKNWVLFLMLVPMFIYFLINSYLPMLGIYLAFTNFNFRDGVWASPFVGLQNFQYLIKADLFKLIRNTVLYNVVFIGVGNVLQILFAILVSQVPKKWFKKTTQTFLFMPYFVSFVILQVLVYNMFEYQYGVINNIVTSLGGSRIDFYNTPSYWPVLITIFYLWKNIGYGMVVYLATIMGIDGELYDAAKVDGANAFQQIWYITLPQIKPTFIILLLYALGSIMKGQFELFYQLVGTNGVLYNVTDIFDTYVYRIALTQPLSIGLGTAAGLFQSLFGFVVVMVTNFLVKRKNEEYALF